MGTCHAPHGNVYDNGKKIGISPLEDTVYPNEDQEEIPDTSEHLYDEDEEEISVVQEDLEETTLCPIYHLNVEISTPRLKLTGSFTLKHPL